MEQLRIAEKVYEAARQAAINVPTLRKWSKTISVLQAELLAQQGWREVDALGPEIDSQVHINPDGTSEIRRVKNWNTEEREAQNLYSLPIGRAISLAVVAKAEGK